MHGSDAGWGSWPAIPPQPGRWRRRTERVRATPGSNPGASCEAGCENQRSMERLSSPKLNRNMNTAGANESSRAPTSIRLRILEPRTRLRWSASNFTMLRNSRTSNVSSSRNAMHGKRRKQEDLARAVRAQKRGQRIEGIQRGQGEDKQEHAPPSATTAPLRCWDSFHVPPCV